MCVFFYLAEGDFARRGAESVKTYWAVWQLRPCDISTRLRSRLGAKWLSAGAV